MWWLQLNNHSQSVVDRRWVGVCGGCGISSSTEQCVKCQGVKISLNPSEWKVVWADSLSLSNYLSSPHSFIRLLSIHATILYNRSFSSPSSRVTSCLPYSPMIWQSDDSGHVAQENKKQIQWLLYYGRGRCVAPYSAYPPRKHDVTSNTWCCVEGAKDIAPLKNRHNQVQWILVVIWIKKYYCGANFRKIKSVEINKISGVNFRRRTYKQNL